MKIRLSIALLAAAVILCFVTTLHQNGIDATTSTYSSSSLVAGHFGKVAPKHAATKINADSLKSTDWYGMVTTGLKQKSFYFDTAAGGKASSINMTQGLKTDYDATSFRISSLQAPEETEHGTKQRKTTDKDWQLCLRIGGLYADGRLASKPALNARQQVAGTELNYRSDIMTVQYQNTKAGVRQNFIVEKAPAPNAKELRVTMQASKGWVVRKTNDREVQFAKQEHGLLHTKLIYNDLTVWDASGKKLPAHMDVQGRDVAIVVAAGGAKYPVTIDPLTYGYNPAITLSAPGFLGTDPEFGSSVISAGDVNGDGYSDVAVLGGGKVSIYQGSSTGLPALSANPTTTLKILDQNSHLVKIGAMATGDVNGDGYSDVIVTAGGNAYVFQGSANGLLTTPTTTVLNSSFRSVTTAGDVNGDGYSDVTLSGSTDIYIYQGSAAGLNTTPTTTILNSNYPIVLLVTAGDVNGDGYGDAIASNQYSGSGGVAYLFLGGAGGLSARASTTLTDPTATNGDEFGYSVSTAGDVNGDGYSDVVIGAAYVTTSQQGTQQGKAYVFMGGAAGLATSPAVSLTGPSPSTDYKFGWAVASVGDINGDGYSDIIVGDQTYPLAPTYQNGLACIFNGSATGTVATPSLILYDPPRNSGTAGESDFFSFSVASAGDINGDGYSDIIVGAPYTYNASNGDARGQAYIYLGVPDNVAPALSGTLNGSAAGDQFGIGIASAGDVNADGFNDVIVGANLAASGQGKAYLYLGSATGLSTTAAAIFSDPGATTGDRFGVSVAGAGDVNGDGYSDVIVGEGAVNAGSIGRAYVYYGNAGGIATSPSLTMSDPGAANANRFGRQVAGAGDINGDGYSDVLISAFGASSNHGAVYVYYGGASGLPTSPSLTLNDPANGTADNFGSGIATAGDVNGDGYSDVLVYGGNMAYLYNGSLSGLSTTAATSVAATNTAIGSAGDVNGDGYSDVVISTSNGFNMYLGSANGLSATATSISGSGTVAVASAGDINGDGYSDVVSRSTSGGVNIYPGSANGLIATAITATYNVSFVKLASAGDVNGDGYSDVIGGNSDATSKQGAAYIVSGNGGYGKHNNMLRLFETDLTTPLKASNLSATQFGIGLFVNPFPGATRARLVWETEANGVPFQHNSPMTNYTGYTAAQTAYTAIPPGGIELKALVNKVGTATKVRVRMQYQKAVLPGGQLFGPWIYPQAYVIGTMGSGVLPIKLLAFTAVNIGNATKVEWSTATETTGSTFIVQRSTDGIKFTAISPRIFGTGNNSSYSFYDYAPLYPVAYYRLQGTEADGAVTYSKIVALHRTGNGRPVVLAPVPASTTVTVTNTNTALNGSQATVWDMQGRQVYRFTLAPSRNIDVSKWTAGIYNVRLADGTLLKMVKQ